MVRQLSWFSLSVALLALSLPFAYLSQGEEIHHLDERPCNIQREPIHRIDEFVSREELLDEPMVFEATAASARHRAIVELGSKASLSDEHGYGTTIVHLTSSNSYSQGDYSMTLSEYINRSSATAASVASRRANESLYLFGNNYDGVWKELMDLYDPPPCRQCKRAGAKTFGLGGKHSGVSWHYHGPGFSEVFIGRKLWLLYPPAIRKPPGFHPNMSVMEWIENRRSFEYAIDPAGDSNIDRQLRECIIRPGEILYFPANWMHATLNLDEYNLFVSLFLDKQLMVN